MAAKSRVAKSPIAKNQSFNSLTPELIQRRHQVHDTCRQFSHSPSKGNLARLKSLFAGVGEEVFIKQGFYCDYGDKITLGHRVYTQST